MMAPEGAVLVVEDNPMTRKMLRVSLESAGYAVLEAADGRAALIVARHGMPSLVLQDLILPDMNGFELLRQLRALPGGREAPIIALSGFLGRIEEAQTEDAGFTASLAKPVEPSRLLDAIRQYVAVPVDASAGFAGGRRLLLVEDDPVQAKVIKLHLEQHGFHVATATRSVEALRYARSHAPDIVLANAWMPDVDGFQFAMEMRRDPKLAGIPLVLSSPSDQTAADEDLARRVGANAFVVRTPNLKGLASALLAALADGPPAQAAPQTIEMELEHANTVIRHLKSQLAGSADLARRCILQGAQIALLGGVAEALTRKTDADVALRDVLAATLDAAGVSKGALFLQDAKGKLSIRHAIGFAPSEHAGLATLFGQIRLLEDAIERQVTVSIPSAALPEPASEAILRGAAVASAQIVPLVSERRGLGAMVLAAKGTDVTNEDSIAFARAMGNQLAQSIELATSFARLAASEERYRTVTESANDAIAILSTDGVLLEVNRSFADSLGVESKQLVGHRIGDFAASPVEGEGIEAAGRAVTGDSPRGPTLLRRADGTLFLMEFSNRTVDVAGDKLVFSIGRDVTERQQAQAQLMVSDRMASVGTLAAGVAHEINNPLAAVAANLEFAHNEMRARARGSPAAPIGEITEALGEASEAANRVRTIVRDLKTFSHAEEERRTRVDVRRVLDSSLRMAWNEVRHRAQLVKEYADVPPVHANESRLGQVFLNLIVNAAQAIGEGHADKNVIRLRAGSDASGRVVVEVEDTGPGMSPEVMRRLFTPFFTTKPPGVGTGLGLSICHRIVTGLRGEIVIDSKVGRGSVFRILLPPASWDAPQPEAAPSPVLVLAPRRGRILIVDDEPIVGNAVRRLLGMEHDVVMLTCAQEALDRIVGGERFDVVVCDLMMPVMTGVEFHEQLSIKSPEHAQRMVFLTGGAFTVKTREFLDHVPNARLEKPFEAHNLRALVNEMLH